MTMDIMDKHMNSKEPHIDDYANEATYNTAWDLWRQEQTAKYIFNDNDADRHISDQTFPSQHTPGAKLDDDKVDMSLLEFLPRAILEVCRVMTYGKIKYTRGGFLEVSDAVNRYSAAMLRHYFAAKEQGRYDQDPFYDTELGAPFKDKILHDAQVAVNALFRLECSLREKEDEEAHAQYIITEYYDNRRNQAGDENDG